MRCKTATSEKIILIENVQENASIQKKNQFVMLFPCPSWGKCDSSDESLGFTVVPGLLPLSLPLVQSHSQQGIQTQRDFPLWEAALPIQQQRSNLSSRLIFSSETRTTKQFFWIDLLFLLFYNYFFFPKLSLTSSFPDVLFGGWLSLAWFLCISIGKFNSICGCCTAAMRC